MKFVDHSQKRFGKMVAVFYDSQTRKWVCKCDCGGQSMVASGDLVRGRSKSCGCSQGSHRHGNSPRGKQTSEYSSWYSMIARCRYTNRPKQERYVGRGIKVCERWREFKNFLADMGPKPLGHRISIERIDNDGNYEPGNCRWATPTEQLNNQSRTVFVEFKGERMSFSDAWRRSEKSVSRDTAYGRYRSGWRLEAAFSRASVRGLSAS